TPTQAAADHPYVIQQIYNAEALWIAGGDQANYVDFWKDGPVEDAIRYLIHVKKVPVGGLSAGMAIQGDAYFSAMNGTVLSAEALANPYAPEMTIGYGDFLDHPILKDVITDTHYDDPDRRGRHDGDTDLGLDRQRERGERLPGHGRPRSDELVWRPSRRNDDVDPNGSDPERGPANPCSSF
ncbi:MAG TPA: hypothetical protein PK362_06170, partial [Elusimicrobiota bacterium]|nr:hypothetical protein [Elusimicrobiota bacterium]